MAKKQPAAAPAVQTSASSTPARFEYIDLRALHPSPTNPRKTFDADKLQALADTIQAHGIVQPITVRAWPAHYTATWSSSPAPRYEIVAGERRFRAASMILLDQAPCMIHELADAQVLAIQIIENLQRSDLDELEEAEGYRTMMAEPYNYTVDQLAEQVGQSRSYLYARLKLLDLCGDVRDAVRNKIIDASRALLIARIPAPSLQVKALKAITQPTTQAEALSHRSAKLHIQNSFMKPFDANVRWDLADTDLIPIAGACNTCPKRTSVNVELFGDVEKDLCTDTDCFAGKATAYRCKVVAEAQASGREVITGDDAKKAMPSSTSHMPQHTRIDDPCYDVAESECIDEDEWPTVAQLIEKYKLDVSPILIENRHTGAFIEAIANSALQAALKKVGIFDDGSGSNSLNENPDLDHNQSQLDSAKNDPHQRLRDERENRLERRKSLHLRIRTALDEHLAAGSEVDIEDIRLVALTTLHQAIEYGDSDSLQDLLLSDIAEEDRQDALLVERVNAMNIQTLLIFLVDTALLCIMSESTNWHDDNAPLMPLMNAMAGRYSVPLVEPVSTAEEKQIPPTPAAHAGDPTAPAETVSEAVSARIVEEAHPSLKGLSPSQAWPFPIVTDAAAANAAQASDTTADETPAAPARANAKTKGKAAAAAKEPKVKDKQSSGAAAGGKVKTPTVATPVLYTNPSDASQTWTGRGRKPAWVEMFLADGGTLDELRTTTASDAATVERCENTSDMFEPGQTDPAETSA
ncbi:MAG TPA: ParB/RepB/Spo0J family partition protein [Rhodocyclaceae bacterium]|nr:ParB/RepB/Spo0J family partition protein [Rhodocyclaceae bacterium]